MKRIFSQLRPPAGSAARPWGGQALALAAFAAFAAFAGGGCRELPPIRGHDVERLVEGPIERVRPADVAVAPVVIAEGVSGSVPERLLREAFARGLIKRHYSALSLEEVDSRTTEASYVPGRLGEEAVLEIVVHRWSDSKWRISTQLEVEIEARLLDASQPGAPPLWAAKLDDALVYASERDRYTTDGALMALVCDDIAEEVVSQLPVREVRPEGP